MVGRAGAVRTALPTVLLHSLNCRLKFLPTMFSIYNITNITTALSKDNHQFPHRPNFHFHYGYVKLYEPNNCNYQMYNTQI